MRIAPLIGSTRARVTLALAVGAFVVGLAPLSDGDLWWHLAAGREIVRTHALPTVDTFSSGAAGRPWIDVHWGFQLVAYALHAVGGLRALVLAKCALVAAGALVLASAVVRAAGPRARTIFAVALVLALFAGRGLLLLRPVIPTLLFMSAFFLLLERFRTEGRARWLAPLPLLQLAWANVQGLSMLGPALVAATALSLGVSAKWGDRLWFPFARERAPAGAAGWALLALGGCLATTAATPYGLAGLALPFGLLHRLVPAANNVYAANVAENVPPWLLARTAPGQMSHLIVFLALLAASFVAARRLLLGHVLMVVALVALALAANRNVLLLYWLGTPIAVIAASPAWRRLRIVLARRRVPLAARWSGRLSLAAALALALFAAGREPGLAEAAPFRAPATSADVIAARGGTGTIFAADQYGGYLIWRLAPAWKPYMDTRLVLRSAEEFAEYLTLADEPSRFDAWEEAHPMDYVLLPVGYPDRYLGLVAHLYGSDRWRLISTDGTEVLFARALPGQEVASLDLASRSVVDGLIAGLDRRFARAPQVREAARVQLAALELAVGRPSEAERALSGLMTPASDQVRARCRLAAGDLDGASALATGAMARTPDDVGGLDVLAVIEARRGDPTKAVALLRRALELDPYDAEAGRILAAWEGDHAPSR